MRIANGFLASIVALGIASAVLASATQASVITIINNDGAGEGFNDPTPAAPVGGNPGVTIGAQRLYVFQYAANIWGSLLPSAVPITVQAVFDPLTCTATSAVLGSAGPLIVWRDFLGAPVPAHWYHSAEANKLYGVDLDGTTDDISARFNSSLNGSPACLGGTGWYLGVDGNEGTNIELLPVVLHELGHGLGFSTTTNGNTGTWLLSYPGIFDKFLLDAPTSLHWDGGAMTNAQRATSSRSCGGLRWDGPSVVAGSPSYLGARPLLRVNAPVVIAGDYQVGQASFGGALTNAGVTGNVVLVNDGVGTVTDACEALTPGSLTGQIALVDRGTCGFVIKVKNCQDAGAIAVIVADNVAGCPPAGLGGADPTITIPSVRVTQADGNILKANLVGQNVTLITDPAVKAGADAMNRVFMFSPNPFQS